MSNRIRGEENKVSAKGSSVLACICACASGAIIMIIIIIIRY